PRTMPIAVILLALSPVLGGAGAPPASQSADRPPAHESEHLAEAAPGSTASIRSRLDAQTLLFAQQHDDDMRASPEGETAVGDYRDNAMLDDYSLAASARQDLVDRAYRTRLAAISSEDFPEQDRLSHDLLLRELDRRLVDYSLKEQEMPLLQLQGIHNSLADLPNAVPLDSVRHYENYIARLRQIPRALAQTMDVLRQGEKDGLMPVRFLLERIPAQCEGIIAENPFLAPTRAFPDSIPAQDRLRLAAEIGQAVDAEVLPAYRHFATFIAEEYAPRGRTTIALDSLPDGTRRYQNAISEQTTTSLSPAEIHALGLAEVARINGLLQDIAHKAGYGDLAHFRAALANDPRYTPTSAAQIIDDFRRYVTQMRPRLPELFTAVPTTSLVVEAVPASQPGNGTHHVDGSPDGSRPGRVVVATSNFTHRTLLADETQAYHEGIPGHELQISVQQRLTGLPAFRSTIHNSAYVEGWAVYAEALGKEIGFFQDPASDYGRLNLELMRAVRLVIDPGMHAMGWTRDQAVDYFRQSGAADEPTIQAEVDRYIAWPAQSLSYKIGQLKILELREQARQALGVRFDLRQFHDEILDAGSLPLDMLQSRVEGWIGSQQPAALTDGR
ncbi:MAG: DUF885 domain-containing protein, partial [Janthinobacterium lividum]